MAFVLALAPSMAVAAEFRGESSGTMSVNEAVNDDLYAGGSSVSLVAPIAGDAVLGGGNVFVSGEVKESILAAGGTVVVSGNVADDVRVLGGNIILTGEVAHDVVVLGGQINISPSAMVGKDLVVLGGMVTIDGAVKGNVFVRGGDVVINAPIGGSVNAKGKTITLGSKASIGGKLIYSSQNELTIGSGIVGGGVEYNKMITKEVKDVRGEFAGLLFAGFLLKIISLLVLALIVTAIFKKRSLALTQNALNSFGWNILYGFAAMVLVPVAAILLLITLIGMPFAMIAMCVYCILLALAGIFAPVIIGSWAWKRISKASAYPVNTYSILIGVVIFAILGLIPIIGWLFGFIFVLVALGTLTRALALGLTAAIKR